VPARVSEILLEAFPELVFAWQGHALLITDRPVPTADDGLEELYKQGIRLLARYRLLLHGRIDPGADAIARWRHWARRCQRPRLWSSARQRGAQ
jgi:hypothetical protein